jgi:hypothetical protein
MGKRNVRDTEMFLDEENGNLEIRRPGWREDASLISTFTPGGEGGGGFPVANARNIVFQSDEILTDIHTSEDGSSGLVSDSNIAVKVNAQVGQDALLLLHADSEDLNECRVRLAVRGSTLLEVIQETGGGAALLAFYGNAGAERLAPIADVTNLAETMAALNLLLAYWRDRGDVLV